MKNRWWIQLLRGGLFLVLGFIALQNPVGALLTFAVYIGYISLFTGLLYLFYFFTRTKNYWRLLEAVLDIVVGLLMISNPELTADLFGLLVGMWMLFLGVTQLAGVYTLRQVMPSGKGWGILSGIISIVLGLMIISEPLSAGIAVTVLMGISFTLYGIIQIILSLKNK